MRRRFNVRFALYMLASLAVLSVGTYFVHGYQVRRNANSLLTQADHAKEQKDVRQEAEYLGRYLGFNPNDADIQARYGELLADSAKTPRDEFRAYLALEKALYRNPNRHDLRRRVVKLGMSPNLGRHKDAGDDIEKLLEKAFPGDGELEGWLGICRERGGVYDKAREAYEKSVKHAPGDVETFARLATLLRRHADTLMKGKETRTDVLKLADRTMDDMVRANEKSYRAYLLRAEYLRTFPPTDPAARAAAIQAAAQDVRRAQGLAGDEPDVVLVSAEAALDRAEQARQRGDAALERGAADEARKLLQQGRDRHPDDWRLYQGIARLETRDGRTDAAIAALNEGLAKSTDRVELLWDLADLHARAGHEDKLRDVLDRLKRAGTPDAERDFLAALLDLKQDKVRDAFDKLKKAAPSLAARSDPNGEGFTARLSLQADLLLARCCDHFNDADGALAAYTRVVARDPRSVPGRLGVAAAQRSLGRTSESLDQYRQLMLASDPAIRVGAAIEVARLLIVRNLGREEKEREWAEVEQMLAEADAAFATPKDGKPQSIPAALTDLRVEMLAARGRYDAARDLILERYRDEASRPVQAWVALAGLDSRQDRPDAALAHLDAAGRAGDSVELRLARGQILARAKRTESGAALERLAEGGDRFDAAGRRNLLNGLAATAAGAGDTAAAGRLWERLLKERPDDLSVQAALFDLAARAKDFAAMNDRIKKIRGIERDDGVLWRHASALTLIAQRQGGDKSADLNEARRLLAEVAARRPNWPRVAMCEAQCDDLEGQTEKALAGYMRVIQSGDRDPLAYSRAIEILYASRRFNEANVLIQKLPASALASTEARRIGSEIAIQSRDGADAVKLAEAVVAAGSKDYRDYLRLGLAHLAPSAAPNPPSPAERYDAALKAFGRARDLAPKEPGTWVPLVQLLAATGKKDQALAEARAAEKQLTGPEATLALAQCFEAAGSGERAKQLYEAAAKATPASAATLQGVAAYYFRTGQYAAAEPLLQRLVKEFESSAPESARWARRNLTFIPALRGDYNQTIEALGQLEQAGATATAGDAAADQRTRATVLAMLKSPASRRQAVGLLEGLIERHMGVPQDHFLAAQLHEAVGDWPRARRRYLSLLNLPGGDTPVYRVIAARSLLRHSDTTGAGPIVRWLEAQDPQSFVTLELKARLLRADGKSAEAVALVQAYAKSADANPLAAAGLLNEFEAYPETEALLRRNAEKSKRVVDSLALAEFLIARKRPADALDLVDGLWAAAGPAELTALADASLASLVKVQSDLRRCERVERHLAEQVKKAPDRADLMAALATVQNYLGRYDDAEQTYLRAVKQNPRQLVSLNNLAFLMALRERGLQALEKVAQATALVGPDPNLLDTRGVAYLALKKPAVLLAIKDLEFAAAETASPDVLFHLAQAYVAAGRREDAVQAWQRAKKLGLDAATLHPLERDAYDRLARDLN